MWNGSLSNCGRNRKESMRAIVKSNKYKQTWAEKVQIEKKSLYTLYRNKNRLKPRYYFTACRHIICKYS